MSLKIEAPKLKSTANDKSQPLTSARGGSDTPVRPARELVSPVRKSESREQTETSLSFSDIESAPSAASSATTEERGVSLHLSSATNSAAEIHDAPAVKPLPPAPLQIKIEDQPTLTVARFTDSVAVPRESVVQVAQSFDSSKLPVEKAGVAALTPTSLATFTKKGAEPAAAAPAAKRDLVMGPELSVKLQDVTPIALESEILELSVEHPGICQLIQTSANTFSVIGLKSGSTRIALITNQSSKNNSVEIREVSVGRPGTADSELSGLARNLTETLRQLFPGSKVEVVAADGSLLVQGVAGSEADARKILTFIRKTSLRPVVDRLKSH